MAQVAAATVWNTPNYFGDLFTADMTKTPVLSMIGGLKGGKETTNFEFPSSVEYDFTTAAQPAITETASLTAPTAISNVTAQVKNVTQIFQEQVSISYARMSNSGRLSGINTAGTTGAVPDERTFQKSLALQKIARDVEYTLLFGEYQIATSATVANKTRGVRATSALTGGTVIDASGAKLSKALLQRLLREMHAAGAPLNNDAVLLTDTYNRQGLGDIYGYAKESSNIGGVNVNTILDSGIAGSLSVAPAHRLMVGGGEILVIHPNYMDIVTQPTPGKGNLFYEELAKTGAGESGQIFGQLGLMHGPAFTVGRIHNLATS